MVPFSNVECGHDREMGWYSRSLNIENSVEIVFGGFSVFFALYGQKYIPIKLKFGMEGYIMHAKVGVGCS